MKGQDLVGRRYGHYVVVGRTMSGSNIAWRCQCDCGAIRLIRTKYMRRASGCIKCVAADRALRIQHERERDRANREASKLRMRKSRERAAAWLELVTTGELAAYRSEPDRERPTFWALPSHNVPHLAAWDGERWVSVGLVPAGCGIHPINNHVGGWCMRCTQVRLETQFYRAPQSRMNASNPAHPWRTWLPVEDKIESFRRRVG